MGTVGKEKLIFFWTISSNDSVTWGSPEHSVRRAEMEEGITWGGWADGWVEEETENLNDTI